MKAGKMLITLGGVGLVVAGGMAYGILRDSSTTVSNSHLGGFSGVLVDGLTNRPIPHASIMASPLHDQTLPSIETTSTEKGAFDFDLSSGAYRIIAETNGYTSRGRNDNGREIDIVDETRFVNGLLRLWPVAHVQGRVVSNGVGIAATVALIYEKDASGAGDYTFKTIETTNNGAFEFSDAYAGVTAVSVSAEGFASIQLQGIALKSGETIDLGDIPMRDGVSLFGTITDETSKRGIKGAHIVVKNTDGLTIAETTTSASGDFRLPPLDMMQVIIDVSADGYHSKRSQFKLSGNTDRAYSAALKRAWGLTIDIQNATARNPIQSHVKIKSIANNKEIYNELLENGVYRLDTLKGAPFLIEVTSFDGMTQSIVRANAGDTAKIRLKPFGKLIVSARLSNGEPVQRLRYQHTYKSALDEPDSDPSSWVSASTSEFEIPDLKTGYYRITVKNDADSKEISSQDIHVKDGDIRRITLQFTEGGVLRGHVVSSVEGYNIANATVSVEGMSLSAVTDDDGNFILDKLPTEPFVVLIKPPQKNDPQARFENIVVSENATLSREFKVQAERYENREKRRERRARFEERMANGEMPPMRRPRPEGDNGTPPWGNGEPPWGNGEPPWGDGEPPWGDGPPPWENGEPPEPPDGEPPWGNGPPPWENGDMPAPPDDEPPWQRSDNSPQGVATTRDAAQNEAANQNSNPSDNNTRAMPRNRRIRPTRNR